MISYKYMTKRNKLIEKILKSNNISFAEAEKVLIFLGYVSEYPQGGSSHKTFRKTGKEKITLVSYQKPLKMYALKLVREIIKNEGYDYEK